MAHEIYELSNGKKSMAYVGEKPWHGLGQQLSAGASIEQWAREAGLDWTLLEAPVTFARELNGEIEFTDFDGQKVLYRSDNGKPLSVVSGRYQKVQPIEVLDFFREFTQAGDMTLETAGSLADGSKIWALAKVGKDFNVNGDNGVDLVKPYVLLATSCDKTLATTGQLTSVRVVCNNTLQMSISGKNAAVKVPHSTKFDHTAVKNDMGLVRESIDRHIASMRKIHRIGVADDEAMKFFLELLKTPEEKKTGKVELDSKRRAIPKLWDSYKGAPGSEDTVWGMVNAVTHSVDFNRHARSDSSRLNSAWFGQGAAMKAQAYELATDSSFLDSIIEKTVEHSGVSRILELVDL